MEKVTPREEVTCSERVVEGLTLKLRAPGSQSNALAIIALH